PIVGSHFSSIAKASSASLSLSSTSRTCLERLAITGCLLLKRDCRISVRGASLSSATSSGPEFLIAKRRLNEAAPSWLDGRGARPGYHSTHFRDARSAGLPQRKGNRRSGVEFSFGPNVAAVATDNSPNDGKA